jgi:ABC-type transporter Mla MlaB component
MSQDAMTMTLLGDANIYEIDQLTRRIKGALDDAMMSGGGLRLDLSQVGDVDATFCQLLAVLQVDAKQSGMPVEFDNAPQELVDLLAELHMEEFVKISAA